MTMSLECGAELGMGGTGVICVLCRDQGCLWCY